MVLDASTAITRWLYYIGDRLCSTWLNFVLRNWPNLTIPIVIIILGPLPPKTTSFHKHLLSNNKHCVTSNSSSNLTGQTLSNLKRDFQELTMDSKAANWQKRARRLFWWSWEDDHRRHQKVRPFWWSWICAQLSIFEDVERVSNPSREGNG